MSTTIEAMLFELGRDIDLPRSPDVREAVRERLAKRPVPMSSWRRLPALGAAAAVALGAVVVLVAPVRHAVADLFGVAGIDISFVDELPAVSPRAGDLRLGELVARGDLDELVEFQVLAPTELGDPDEIWFDEAPVGGAITFVYYPDGELKESDTTGVGALLTQFSGTLYPEFSKKLIESGDTTVDIVSVGGLDAFFISGGDHVVLFIDADGETQASDGRLAGNVLVWEKDGQTFRLEADVGVRRALEIARSLMSF